MFCEFCCHFSLMLSTKLSHCYFIDKFYFWVRSSLHIPSPLNFLSKITCSLMHIFKDNVLSFTETLYIGLVFLFSEKASWKSPVYWSLIFLERCGNPVIF